MNIIVLVDKVKNKVLKKYREYVFFKETGQRANLVKNVILINRNLRIGKNVTIYPNVMFFGDGIIEIGDNVDIGNDTIIYSSKNGGGVYIGNDTMIAAQSYLIDVDHGIKDGKKIREQENVSSPIHIGNDVWIAANCTILKGSIIADGTVVGAKSLVKGHTEENSVVVGIPAKIVKYRT